MAEAAEDIAVAEAAVQGEAGRERSGEAEAEDIDPTDVVVVLDWFAPHLHEAVKSLCRKWGVKLLHIGGCITGDVQTLDTHKHHPLTQRYRQAEIIDAARALEL